MYYDSHTHLNSNELYPEWKGYLQRFIDAAGKWLVNIGVDAERNQRAIDIAIQAKKQFPDTIVKATIGFHPFLVCSEKISQNSSSWQGGGTRRVGGLEEDNLITIQDAIYSLKTLYHQHSSHIVAIGECGIDTHYNGDPHIDLQKELFAQQCDLAVELHLPIVTHAVILHRPLM